LLKLTIVMPATRVHHLLLLMLFVFLQTNQISFCQSAADSIEQWVKKLKTNNDPENKGLQQILLLHYSKDSAFVYNHISQLENTGPQGHYFKARLCSLKSEQGLRFAKGVDYGTKLCEQALNEAYETDDDYFISWVSWHNGVLMALYQQIELSVTYFLKADEMNEHLEKKPAFNNSLLLNLGEIFFHSREYEKCVAYVKKGLYNWHDTGATADYFRIRFWNTVGQAYKELGLLDSAMANYQRSMQLVNKLNELTWRGINSVFVGEVYLLRKDYARAKQFIEFDYKVKYTDEPNVSGYGLQLLARINLAQGDKDSALQHIRQALQLLMNSNNFPVQKMNYLQSAYHTASEVYRELGNIDSFYHYNQLYGSLHDSLERIATLSSIKMAQLRINNEKNHQTVLSLQREKKAEELNRNFIIAVILLLSIIAFFYVNRLRLKHHHEEQLALQEKKAAEAEILAAKEQLELFTQNVIEKTTLIEHLQGRLDHRALTGEQQELASSMASLTILTDTDWEKFKTLFEKIYPGFFINLKEKVSDITLAEQRMAALTRLHLTTRQIGSILGISPNSVNKTKQRLRQRLNLEPEVNIEEMIAKI
jgi:hypothetical protein